MFSRLHVDVFAMRADMKLLLYVSLVPDTHGLETNHVSKPQKNWFADLLTFGGIISQVPLAVESSGPASCLAVSLGMLWLHMWKL